MKVDRAGFAHAEFTRCEKCRYGDTGACGKCTKQAIEELLLCHAHVARVTFGLEIK